MPRATRRWSKKAGLPPGSLVYTGNRVQAKTNITLINYDKEDCQEQYLKSFDECLVYKNRPGTFWINVEGISRVADWQNLGECFNLHPLVLEDIAHVDQRPKLEDYEEYLFVVLKAITYDRASRDITADQVSLILGPNYVISLHEGDQDLFGAIRERLMTGKGRLRKAGADYLAYAMIDLLVDQYFQVLEEFGDTIESLEDEVVSQPTPATLREIHRFKNDMIVLRRSLWPVREVVGRLERRESPLISDATSFYFKDVYDHAVVASDTVETYRDILSGMLDIYLSSVSNKLNEIMKVLTIIATIFMPLTFLAGLYGMNFKFMPELDWRWGYFGVLGIMATIAVFMLIYFKRRGWL